MKPPPQFGQTFFSTLSTQSPQKVHSKEQIHASAVSGGSARLQCSQPGLSSSMARILASATTESASILRGRGQAFQVAAALVVAQARRGARFPDAPQRGDVRDL